MTFSRRSWLQRAAESAGATKPITFPSKITGIMVLRGGDVEESEDSPYIGRKREKQVRERKE